MPNQMGNNYQAHGGGGHNQRGGIQNRLNFNAANAEPVPHEPTPHKQVHNNEFIDLSCCTITNLLFLFHF